MTMRALSSVAIALATMPVPSAQGGGPAMYGYKVIATYPHDIDAFTQGLVYREGFLYESTGRYGESSLRKVRLGTGQVVQERRVDKRYFAEGLTSWQNHLIQLTWREGQGFVYDLASFKPLRNFTYKGEGWGLTHDGKRLILSDGSATLRFLNPDTFAEMGQIHVQDRGAPVLNLNELEFVNGEIYANVWHTDRIARIAPDTGAVLAWIDLAGLLRPGERRHSDAVLNGIAYDAAGSRLFVTGKLWPKIFHIELVRKNG